MPDGTPFRILLVCMGNICRSPLAENVLRHKVRQRGVEHLFAIDSAGTGGWHVGEPPDARVSGVASKHGIPMTGVARQVTREDFQSFDLLICMDQDNREHLLAMGAPADRVRLLLDFDPKATHREVPDPYYGGADGFELVYQLVDSASEMMLNELLAGREA
jgi:protein-tyrosine phosphatase